MCYLVGISNLRVSGTLRKVLPMSLFSFIFLLMSYLVFAFQPSLITLALKNLKLIISRINRCSKFTNLFTNKDRLDLKFQRFKIECCSSTKRDHLHRALLVVKHDKRSKRIITSRTEKKFILVWYSKDSVSISSFVFL